MTYRNSGGGVWFAQLEITYADGTADTVATDESWDWSNDGPIRFADNKDGEVVNANREPSYSGKAKVTAHKVIPTASNMPRWTWS